MTDEPTTIQRAALDQENPKEFLVDLQNVRDSQESVEREFRRFKLELELDADDLDRAISEVQEVVDE